jgi:hypothetical protein
MSAVPVTHWWTVDFAIRLYRTWHTEPEQTWALWVLRENAMRADAV